MGDSDVLISKSAKIHYDRRDINEPVCLALDRVPFEEIASAKIVEGAVRVESLELAQVVPSGCWMRVCDDEGQL